MSILTASLEVQSLPTVKTERLPLREDSPPSGSLVGQPPLTPLEPIVFVRGSEPTLRATLCDKYQPVNPLRPINGVEEPKPFIGPQLPPSLAKSTPAVQAPAPNAPIKASGPSVAVKTLDTVALDWKWHDKQRPFGLFNMGNTCFMNSVLQILLHTPPWVNAIIRHSPPKECPLSSREQFCMTCVCRSFIYRCFVRKSNAFTPDDIFQNIRRIAPHFRKYHQEDAHEFLRFIVDKLQVDAQGGEQHVPNEVAKTSWLHHLFGGEFRSRITCDECGHNSDTFDLLLDINVEIGRCATVQEALRKFSAAERLDGKNKYQCDKCKKPVNAEKKMTVHKAPQALCVQLKRFTPWGRKIPSTITYERRLTLAPIMSEKQPSPTYSLYGIIVHAGSSPNSGHYYTFAKSKTGRWYRMNDDEVDSVLEPPYGHRNAYMLFYMRDSDSLETAVAQATGTSPEGPSKSSSSIGKKRAREDDDVEEDVGKPVHHSWSSSNGAGPSNPAGGRKVSGMLPKQDRPPQPLHTAKPSLARPPHNRLPDSEDEREEEESPQLHNRAKLDLGVSFSRTGDRAEGKKKKKKTQENIAKLSSLSLSGKERSLDLRNVSSDLEEEELGVSHLANTAVIHSSPPLPPSTSPLAAMPSPLKKRKLVDYSSGGESGATDNDDADGDPGSKKSRASSTTSSASSWPERREHEDATLSDRVPGSMFAPRSFATPQQQRWDRPKKQKYSSQRKQEERRKKGFGNPFAHVGH